jgi:hypothetical protein
LYFIKNFLFIFYYIFKRSKEEEMRGPKGPRAPNSWEGGERPLPKQSGSARVSDPRTFFFLLSSSFKIKKKLFNKIQIINFQQGRGTE